MNPFHHLKRPLPSLALALSLAGLGQFFLARQGSPEALILGVLLDLAAILCFVQYTPSSEAKNPSMSRAKETIFFSLIFIEALLFRLVKLDQIPAGLNSDAGNMGWGALRVLHEGWLPLFRDIHASFIIFPPLSYYELALWFHFFVPTQTSLFACGSFLSLLAFPLIYWFFRQIAGAPIALLTLALMAPMRWDVTLSRMAHPAADLHFLLFGCLAFGYYALESKKPWAWYLSTIFLALGFYGYPSILPLGPLIVILLGYEIQKRQIQWKEIRPIIEKCALLFLVLSAPMWVDIFANAGFRNPRDHLSIFDKVNGDFSWLTLLENPIRTALMFNHQGDGWPPHNLAGRRMLDDVTGTAWVLGLGLALSRWKRRPYFYALAAVPLMCLPAALTINPAHAARTFGAAPFAAFLAAAALLESGQKLAAARKIFLPWARAALLTLLLALAAFQNAKLYFVDLPRSPDFDKDSALVQTAVGKAIRDDGCQNDYYLEPHLLNNDTIHFLDYFERASMRALPWPEAAPPEGKGAWFILDHSQSGILDCLRKRYPSGRLSAFQDPQGITQCYFYKVTPQDLIKGRQIADRSLAQGQGLWGQYETPFGKIQRLDPVLNFADREDFPVQTFTPLKIQWAGSLRVRQRGAYQFLILTTDLGGLKMDSADILRAGNVESAPVTLNPGLHPLHVSFEKRSGFFAIFHLLWKGPGMNHFEIIPEGAFQAPRPSVTSP